MTADNAEKSLNVDLSAKSKLIPYSSTAGMLGLNDLYTEERNACENYRMIFTVSPICTNVLYNAVTEPVYEEGSYSAVSLVDSSVIRATTRFNGIFRKGTFNQSGTSIDQKFAVRDTEISHEKIGNFKYHCGYDIFNNHLLRTDDFNHVMLETSGINKDQFNTIFDFAVDYSGNVVTRVVNDSEGPATPLIKVPVRMYQLDNIKSINTAFYDNFRTVDGWYGFYNTGYINIPNGKLGGEEISVNRILNNESPCGFIDMYPDRSLYSFIPKVNRHKKRIERNWDCAIVYPYENDYDKFNQVMLNFTGTSKEWENFDSKKIPYGVKVLSQRVVYNNVGDPMVEMHSLLRHTLKPGDDIRLFYAKVNPETGFDEIIRYSPPVKIVGTGDAKGNDTNRYFTIKLSSINTFCDILKVEDEVKLGYVEYDENGKRDVKESILFFYRKIENGYDDRYYFRKFKRLSNYDYVETTIVPPDKEKEVVEVTKEPTIVKSDSPEYIKFGDSFFKRTEIPLSYSQNKLAFGENIYGDRVAQVIFNDDICITGLKDNLGRPLSTVYFMAEKTNRGHNEWYVSGITSADTIEYSHCFGEVTSGLDLPEDETSTDFNVRKLYNVFSGSCKNKDDIDYINGLKAIMKEAPTGSYIDGTPLPLESGLTLDGEKNDFYGDIVEFSKARFIETTIEKVYHRFNTAQRECLENVNYYDINYDELVGDIYDVDGPESNN